MTTTIPAPSEVNLLSNEADGKIETYQHPVVVSSDSTNCPAVLTAYLTDHTGAQTTAIDTTTNKI